MINNNTLHNVIKSWKDILVFTLEVLEETKGGGVVIELQNKV